MNDQINWKGLSEALSFFSQALSMVSSTTETIFPSSESSIRHDLRIDDNPLLRLPFYVRESITTDFYEPGKVSLMEKYILEKLINNRVYLQQLMNDLFKLSTRKQSHILSYNTIVVLSQLPYEMLGSWADALAISATRSPYLDVAEIGVRCFENWEDKSACEYLKGCRFEEPWLQEYANEVCAYIEEAEITENVLPTEDYTWQMASRGNDSTSDLEGYTSRYSFSGTTDR